MISMIASVGKNMELGRKNSLIWHIPDDMKFFKETTMGHVVVMGKNTYDSLPGNLPGRTMLVLNTSKILDNDNVQTIYSVDEILEKYTDSDEEVFIIGGASVYSQFIQYASILYLTEIDDECIDADTFFPLFDKSKWKKQILYSNYYKNNFYNICKYSKK